MISVMVVGRLVTRGCRSLSHMHVAYFFLYVMGRSFVSFGVAKCPTVRLGQVAGVGVTARIFFSFPFCTFLAARGFLHFSLLLLLICGRWLVPVLQAMGLASLGPQLGGKGGVLCASLRSESWGVFLYFIFCPSVPLTCFVSALFSQSAFLDVFLVSEHV